MCPVRILTGSASSTLHRLGHGDGMEITPIDGRNWEKQYPAGRGDFTA